MVFYLKIPYSKFFSKSLLKVTYYQISSDDKIMRSSLLIVFLHPAVFHLHFRVQVFLGPGFSESRFFRVHVFLGPGFSGSRFFRFQGPGFSGSRSRVRVQGLGPGFRSSHRLRMFFKIVLLKNFAIFTEKHLCWGL